jgi:uncharacterized RDD family membrane protein YckC
MSDPNVPPFGDFPPPGQYPQPGQNPPPPAGGPAAYGYQQQGYGYGYAPVASYGGFWRRFLASLLDGIIVGIPMNIVVVALSLDAGPSFVLRIAAAAIYYSLLEGGPKGQTVGKSALGLRVVDATSMQPGIGGGRACGRYFAKFLSGIALALGYLWMLWDPRKQTWHDKLASTVVVTA